MIALSFISGGSVFAESAIHSHILTLAGDPFPASNISVSNLPLSQAEPLFYIRTLNSYRLKTGFSLSK